MDFSNEEYVEANVNKEEYDARKEKVLDFMTQTISLLERHEGEEENIAALEKIKSDVEAALFSIVLIGEFSAGKSTFLNALMGKRILPSFSNETTATVNILRHVSKSPNGKPGMVYYKNGDEKEIDELTVTTLENVVSTRGDTDDNKIAQVVDHVDLFLDSPFLEQGVMLIDSPGLNGLAEYHRELTERQMKSSHAAIYMFRANQPGTKTDYGFLRNLKNKLNNVFLVLNRIDDINNEEESVEAVIEKMHENYKKQFPDEKTLPTIWPVSAISALTARDESIKEYKNEKIPSPEYRKKLEELSQMKVFEDRLMQYLFKGERTRDALLEPMNRCLKMLAELNADLQNKITALRETPTAEEREKEKADLEDTLNELNQSRANTTSGLRDMVNSALDEAKEQGEADCVKLEKSINSTVNSMNEPDELLEYAKTLPNWITSKFNHIGAKVADRLREDLTMAVQEEYSAWIGALEEKMDDSFKKANVVFNAEPLNLNQTTVNFNIAQFEEKRGQKLKEIEELKTAAYEAEANSIEAKATAQKLEAAKRELKSLDTRIVNIENMVIPGADVHTERVRRERKRKGFLGWIANGLVGPEIVFEDVQIKDYEARNQEIERQNQLKAQAESEKAQIKAEIGSLNGKGLSAERAELEKKRLEEQLQEAQQKYIEESTEFTKKINKANEKLCKNLRREILSYADQSKTDYLNQLRRSLIKMKSECVATVRDLLNANVDAKIERTKKQLDELIKITQADGEKREQMLKDAEEAEKTAAELIDGGTLLYEEIKAEMNDIVEQEAL